MNKFTVLLATALPVLFSGALYAADIGDVTEGSPYYYQAAPGTIIGPDTQTEVQGDTDSGINHLPVYHGSMQTNNTYRFVNIAEQVFTMIGDGKHGLWRLQDNGTVRLYITDEAEAAGGGIAADAAAGFDLENPREAQQFALTLSAADIGDNYTHFDDSASFGAPGAGGFKSFRGFNGDGAPGGGIVNTDGNLTFLDVPIFHEFFGGKYSDHRAIDLANYYCTMSDFNIPKASPAMDFAFDQPGANKIGPLGVRAGLDITENYPRVLRLDLFPDARIWVNTKMRDNARWQAVDTDLTKAEIYLVERPSFNEEYLFITVVFDNRTHRAGRHSYVRPDGPYYDHLMDRGLGHTFRTRIIEQPLFNVLRTTARGKERAAGLRKLEGTRLYGIHHPGSLTRIAGGNGSGCPSVGGDFGEDFFGAAWPTNYQEVTPLCDGAVIDIKLTANLDGATWRDADKNLANNTGSRNGDGTPVAEGSLIKNYLLDDSDSANPGTGGGDYGRYTDPYLTNELGVRNRDAFVTSDIGIPAMVPNPADPDGDLLQGILYDLKYPFARDQVECNGDSCPNSPSSP